MLATTTNGGSEGDVWSDRVEAEEGGTKDCPLESTVGKGEERCLGGREHHRHQHHDGRRWLAWENPDQVRFNILFSFLFRYGDTWTPWRLMQNPGFQDNSVEKTLELDASCSGEAINWITGYSANDDGWAGRTS